MQAFNFYASNDHIELKVGRDNKGESIKVITHVIYLYSIKIQARLS